VNYRKKLIEVALPLKAINEASAREKSIRHGHPSTLHLWWARRPLAACRAVLFSSLVDDPSSDPEASKLSGETREHWIGEERQRLHWLIEQLVPWENSNNRTVIRAARAEIARCVASLALEKGELKKDTKLTGGETVGSLIAKGRTRIDLDGVIDADHLPDATAVDAFLTEHAPPVLDPFCGGGSIPLEAQRLGLHAYASDLNPVAVLITKALIEIPPKFAGLPPVNPEWQARSAQEKALVKWEGTQGLAEDVRYYGSWMRDEAERRIGHLYPKVKVTADMAEDRPDLTRYVGQELTVIAWLWARTVPSPNPACGGIPVPLVRSFWLSSKQGLESWVEPVVDRALNEYHFVVRSGRPTTAERKLIGDGTKIGRGCRFRCLLSNEPIPEEYVKTFGMKDGLGQRMMAIVAQGNPGRVYLSPMPRHERCSTDAPRPLDIPQIEAPIANDKRALWCQLYGLTTFDRLFTHRQLTLLTTLSDLVREIRAHLTDLGRRAPRSKDFDAYALGVATYSAFAVDRMTDRHCSLSKWDPNPSGYAPKISNTFGRQALPMSWDFAEGNPFSDSSGNLADATTWVAKVLENAPASPSGSSEQGDAMVGARIAQPSVVATDPPYYDNIGYADLSDFFYVWLRRSLGSSYPDLFQTVLTPKAEELIASPYRFEGSRERARDFFEEGLGRAFGRMRHAQTHDFPVTVFYAFRQAEADDESDSPGPNAAEGPAASTGWETMLQGLVAAGFAVTGTWPIRTELTGNLKKRSNALASSVALVCRPRPRGAHLATRKEFMSALRQELPTALRNLQHGNIAPVDLAQASIGPGMAVFTRYVKVIESDGSPMTVRTALGIINQVLDEVLAEQEGEFDADTRWALAWFEQFGMAEEAFGVAETLSKAKNTAVNGLVEAGIVKAKAGKVKLVGRADLTDDWDPTTDKRFTVWETTQHLIRALETEGESAAAALLNQLGGMGDTARDLAYRLYLICERKKWAEEALAYNSLVIAWPELMKLAYAERVHTRDTQREMF
jgi:putative DNA methylase